jgi:signal peptidase
MILPRASTTQVVRRGIDVALLGLVLAVLLAAVLARVVPLTGRQTFVIGGSSMEPSVPRGSAVVVTPADPSTIRVGDVISIKVPPAGVLFTHRVVDVVDVAGERRFVTRGDANAAPDPSPVPAAWVVGRVELSVPFLGFLIALLGIPTGIAFLLSLGLTLLSTALLIESFEREPAGGPRPKRVFVPRGAALLPSPGPGGSVAHLITAAGVDGVHPAHWRSVGRSRRRSGWVVGRRAHAGTGTG